MKIQQLIPLSMTIILTVRRLAFVRSFTAGFPQSRRCWSSFLPYPSSSSSLPDTEDVTQLPTHGIDFTTESRRRRSVISSSSRTLLHSVAKPSNTQSDPTNRGKSPNRGSSRSSSSSNISNHSNSNKVSTSSSTSPPSLATQKKPKQANNNESNTGGLRRLPVIKSPAELINRSRNAAKRVKADITVKNARNRARKHAAETLNGVAQGLCVPLRDVVKGYKYELSRLHPFEKVVADLTARARQKKDGLVLQDVLDEINEARKELLIAGKDWIAKAKNAETARDAMEFMKEGEERLYELFEELASKPVKLLIELQKDLRTTPAVRLDTPAVVLVGAPNVGKSSIVRAISSATPEVNNYPFTTRGMTLGHVQVFWNDETTAAAAIIPEINEVKKGRFDAQSLPGNYAFTQLCQVMDSPGLLARADSERNEMEALTLAAMQHLPTAVMYVMDLSGGAGDRCSSVSDQLALRREVRARFPRRPWIDVVSKFDLGLVDGAREELERVLDGAPYIELSIKDGQGVDELRDEVMRMLGEVRVVLDAMAAVDQRNARPSPQKTSS